MAYTLDNATKKRLSFDSSFRKKHVIFTTKKIKYKTLFSVKCTHMSHASVKTSTLTYLFCMPLVRRIIQEIADTL